MLSDELVSHFGLRSDDLQHVHRGVTADLFRAGDLAIKVFRHPIARARNEFNVLTFLDGRFGVPRAYQFFKHRQCAISQDWVDGEPLSDIPDRAPDLMYAVGQKVARFHELDVPTSSNIKNTDDEFSLVDRLMEVANAVAPENDVAGAQGLAWLERNIGAVSSHRGLVHRDVKPENILVTPEDDVVIIDWEFGGRYPAAWDFAKLRSGIFFTQSAIDAFERGYVSVRPIPREDEVRFFTVFEFFTRWAGSKPREMESLIILLDLLREYGG